eukprot:873496-Amphidinium_carterae.1
MALDCKDGDELGKATSAAVAELKARFTGTLAQVSSLTAQLNTPGYEWAKGSAALQDFGICLKARTLIGRLVWVADLYFCSVFRT